MAEQCVSRGDVVDRELERRVENHLLKSHVPAGRALEIHADKGVVTVRGKVKSFYQKQVCAHSCRRVAGVQKLIDDIEVVGVH